MNNSDKKLFATEMEKLTEAFSKTLSRAGYDAYWEALSGISIGELQSSVRSIVATARFFPKPVEIRESAGDVSVSLCAEIAWEKSLAAARRYGRNQSVQFEDPNINPAIRRIGGYLRICNCLDETLPFLHREFLAAYGNVSRYTAVSELGGITNARGSTEPVWIECPYGKKQTLSLVSGSGG